MKKLLCILFICLNISLNAEELIVTLLEKKKIDYPNGIPVETEFRILCVNGYKWLQSGVGNSQSTSQMFDDHNPMGYAQPIKCKN